MLAIANAAHDDWQVADLDFWELVRLTHLDKRTCARLIKGCVASGELFYQQGDGRGRRSAFLVTVGFNEREIARVLVRHPNMKYTPMEADLMANRMCDEREKLLKLWGERLQQMIESEKRRKGKQIKGGNLPPFLDRERAADCHPLFPEKGGTYDTKRAADTTQKGGNFVSEDSQPYIESTDTDLSLSSHKLIPYLNLNHGDGEPQFLTLSEEDRGAWSVEEIHHAWVDLTGEVVTDRVRALVADLPKFFSSCAVVEIMRRAIEHRRRKANGRKLGAITSFGYFKKIIDELARRCGDLIDGKTGEDAIQAARGVIEEWEPGLPKEKSREEEIRDLVALQQQIHSGEPDYTRDNLLEDLEYKLQKLDLWDRALVEKFLDEPD